MNVTTNAKGNGNESGKATMEDVERVHKLEAIFESLGKTDRPFGGQIRVKWIKGLGR